MGSLFSRIWKNNENQNDLENLEDGLINLKNSENYDDDDQNHEDQNHEEMISYPDTITSFNFQHYFRMKTKKQPEGIHWNLFMHYDVDHTQTITFDNFLKIVQQEVSVS